MSYWDSYISANLMQLGLNNRIVIASPLIFAPKITPTWIAVDKGRRPETPHFLLILVLEKFFFCALYRPSIWSRWIDFHFILGNSCLVFPGHSRSQTIVTHLLITCLLLPGTNSILFFACNALKSIDEILCVHLFVLTLYLQQAVSMTQGGKAFDFSGAD